MKNYPLLAIFLFLSLWTVQAATFKGVWYAEGETCESIPIFYSDSDGFETIRDYGLNKAKLNARNECIVKNIQNSPMNCLSIENSSFATKTKSSCETFEISQSIAICKCEVNFVQN